MSPRALMAGTILKDYRIEDVLGSGGFGITYRAHDRRLQSTVAIKEYFPSQIAIRQGDQTVASRSGDSDARLYEWGLDKFRHEADSLAKLQHPNIVGVHFMFEANNTSYMVLDFIEGFSMKAWLKQFNRRPNQQEIDTLFHPLLDALAALHEKGLLHRDVAPKNIMIAKSLRPVLIDFGAARLLIAHHSQTVANMLTPGYAPCEQYSNSGQGPWTDIYALAVTFYEAIYGSTPPEGLERILDDRYIPAATVGRGRYHPSFLEAIDWGLRPKPNERPQSIAEWRKAMTWLPRGPGSGAPLPGGGPSQAPHKPSWLRRKLDTLTIRQKPASR